MKIEVFYDTLCSWCRVGKINFKHAVEKLASEGKINPNDIELVLRSYIIYPEVPKEGLNYRKVLEDDDDLEMIDPKHDTPIHRWGKRVGMTFNFENIKIKPNTMQAHQFLKLIDPKLIEPLLADIHTAYFENGININDLNVICELAKKYVSNVDKIKKRVLAGEGKAEVEKDIEIADAYNIDLVPLYVFDGKVRLEGAILQKKFEEALLGQIEPNM